MLGCRCNKSLLLRTIACITAAFFCWWVKQAFFSREGEAERVAFEGGGGVERHCWCVLLY